MRHFVVIAVFFLAASLTAQVEHAPTVAQCQADQRLWLSQIEADHGTGPLPGYSVIDQWWREMSDCMSVDPENKMRYYNTESEVMVEQKLRMEHFIGRHLMWDKFIEEDKSGQR